MERFSMKANLLKRKSIYSKTSDIIIYFIIIVLSMSSIIPLLYVISISLTGMKAYYSTGPSIIPHELTFEAYKVLLFNSVKFLRALKNSAVITLFGTLTSVLFTSMAGYAMSKRKVPGRTAIIKFLYISSYFSGGLIPLFLVIRGIGLLNSYWALILPNAVSMGTALLMKNFFLSLPEPWKNRQSLMALREVTILFKIILPISLPIFATVSLFYAVGYWNVYSSALFFLSDSEKFPLMVLLTGMLESVKGGNAAAGGAIQQQQTNSLTLRMAALCISVLPIMLLYPFLQKYFIKGLFNRRRQRLERQITG